mmetsp:Transcript_80603/g.152204  ORF Transcript_80603/g.152204 Transcript_80603/m.152204 type:complete len:91 (-) Transcript_80603:33-305(-)
MPRAKMARARREEKLVQKKVVKLGLGKEALERSSSERALGRGQVLQARPPLPSLLGKRPTDAPTGLGEEICDAIEGQIVLLRCFRLHLQG